MEYRAKIKLKKSSNNDQNNEKIDEGQINNLVFIIYNLKKKLILLKLGKFIIIFTRDKNNRTL